MIKPARCTFMFCMQIYLISPTHFRPFRPSAGIPFKIIINCPCRWPKRSKHSGYSLTANRKILLGNLTFPQLFMMFPALHGKCWFITALTKARHLSLSWHRSIQFKPSNPIFVRCISVLFSHLRLGLPTDIFPCLHD